MGACHTDSSPTCASVHLPTPASPVVEEPLRVLDLDIPTKLEKASSKFLGFVVMLHDPELAAVLDGSRRDPVGTDLSLPEAVLALERKRPQEVVDEEDAAVVRDPASDPLQIGRAHV